MGYNVYFMFFFYTSGVYILWQQLSIAAVLGILLYIVVVPSFMTLVGRLMRGYQVTLQYMMTSSNGNIFRVTGSLCGEFTGLRWFPRTKASDAKLWCFLWSAPE